MNTEEIVVIDYNDLISSGVDVSRQISDAYGFEGLGILLVKNVPGYREMRARLLPLAKVFAELDDSIKAKYEHPESFYSFGWSHGKEKLQGSYDISKGSYYANPSYDRPIDDEDVIRQYASFVHPNIWPSEDLPQFESVFKDLGRLIVATGTLIAKHCDKYVSSRCPTYPEQFLSRVIEESRCCKARLLHYFPKPAPSSDSSLPVADTAEKENAAVANNTESLSAVKSSAMIGKPRSSSEKDKSGSESLEFSSWCGFHNDHGSLTGLTSPMLLDASGGIVADEDPTSGLYALNRRSELIKVTIPEDCLAFQIGEAAQIHSGGILQATPHAVRASNTPCISRETFAVFMEPMWDQPMHCPDGVDPQSAQSPSAAVNLPAGVPTLTSRWNPSQDFGEFTACTLKAYH